MNPIIIAHRGYSGRYIENTLPAFEAAAAVGAEWIECDVHLSRDGQVVIHHDEKLNRLANRYGKITDYTLAELQLMTLKQGNLISTIPSLADYLSWAQTKPILTNIEIKRNKFMADNIEEKVVHLVNTYKTLEQTVISSFDHRTLHQVKKLDPSLKIAYLINKWTNRKLKLLNQLEPDYIHIRHDMIIKKRIQYLHEAGYKINTWTVNQPEQIEKMLALGVDGIVTDYLDKALHIRENFNNI